MGCLDGKPRICVEMCVLTNCFASTRMQILVGGKSFRKMRDAWWSRGVMCVLRLVGASIWLEECGDFTGALMSRARVGKCSVNVCVFSRR